MSDSKKQIEVLEAELVRLRGVLSHLSATMQDAATHAVPEDSGPRQRTEPPVPPFFWLVKLAVTLGVAAVLAGFFILIHVASSPLPREGGGVLALLLAAWGLLQAAPGRLLSQGVLACGLGMAFISGLALAAAYPSAPLSLAMLILVAASAAALRWRRSEAVFGVVAALACVCAVPDAGFHGAGGLGMASVLACSVFLLSGPRAGTFPLWAACAAVFAQLALPLVLTIPTAPPLGSLAKLLLIQSIISLACVRYAVRGGDRVYNAASLVFANAILCVAVSSSVLDGVRGHAHAVTMALTALLFAALAGVAHARRPSANPIMASFATAAMVAAAMGMWSGLPESLFAPALAAGSAILVPVYRQTGSHLLRRLETISALAAFGFCLFRLQLGGLVALGPITVPANWLNALGTMVFLCIAAKFHDKCLSVGPFRQPQHATSLACAAMAALTLLAITVLARGADAALPFVLAAESLGMVGLGLLLFTPQIAVAGMFLLAPAHLCYHAFLLQPLPGFAAQPDFVANSAGLVAFTLVGAAAWERYLRRFHQSTAEWDHYAVVALPWLAAAFLSHTVLRTLLPASLLPAAMAALGLLCLAPSRILRLDGLALAALFCFAAAVTTFGLRIYTSLSAPPPDSLFVPGTTSMIVLFVTAERLATWINPAPEARPHRPSDALRLLLCVFAALTAAAGLWAAAQGAVLGWGMTGTAVLFYCLGHLCAVPLYQIFGVLMLLGVPGLAFLGLRGMAPGMHSAAALISLAAMAVVTFRGALRRRVGEDTDASG